MKRSPRGLRRKNPCWLRAQELRSARCLVKCSNDSIVFEVSGGVIRCQCITESHSTACFDRERLARCREGFKGIKRNKTNAITEELLPAGVVRDTRLCSSDCPRGASPFRRPIRIVSSREAR